MRIVSPFKDYYDYLQGTIGQDPLAYYERIPMVTSDSVHSSPFLKSDRKVSWSKQNFVSYQPVFNARGDSAAHYLHMKDDSLNRMKGYVPNGLVSLHLCGLEYKFVVDHDNTIYAPPFVKENSSDPRSLYDLIDKSWPERILVHFEYKRWSFSSTYKGCTETDLNERHGCPIILCTDYATVKNPRLLDLKLNKVIPAEEMYLMLTNWLLSQREPPAPEPVSDKNKILSHGMDPKTSFRSTMK